MENPVKLLTTPCNLENYCFPTKCRSIYEVLHRPKFHKYIDEEEIRIFLAALTRESEWIDVDVQLAVCRDPKDDKFLELAVCGRATHLVTGDQDLLVLNPFHGVSILAPASFLSASLPRSEG